MKDGLGITVAAIETNDSYLSQSFPAWDWMCCFCGDNRGTPGQPCDAECRSCGATLRPDSSRRRPTEIERRDMQIHTLKYSVASNWDMHAFLFKYIVDLEAGLSPEWPDRYGGHSLRKGGKTPAQIWYDNNFARGTKGDDLAVVTETWRIYGGRPYADGPTSINKLAVDEERGSAVKS